VAKGFRQQPLEDHGYRGGLRRWQIDCYFGEDEPLGPASFRVDRVRPLLEYAYANARIVN